MGGQVSKPSSHSHTRPSDLLRAHAHGHDDGHVDPVAVAAGHEVHTASVAGLLKFTLFFVLGMAATLFVVFEMYNVIDAYFARDKSTPASSLSGQVPVLPPEPRLQPAPTPGNNKLDREEMADLRAKEDAEFARRNWVLDPATGKFQVPASLVNEIQQYGAHGPTIQNSTGAQSVKGAGVAR
jgi:hypothetical protein